MTRNKKVVFVQQRLTHYREKFLIAVRDELRSIGVDFEFVHTLPNAEAQKKNDAGFLPWAFVVKPIEIGIKSLKAIWIPIPTEIGKPDLLILTQENKLVANYYWMLLSKFSTTKLAFFGHGKNFQSNKTDGVLEKWKSFTSRQVDWWFAYTEYSKKALIKSKVDESKITVLNNAIDNVEFRCLIDSVLDSDVVDLKAEISIQHDSKIALFCGSLYPIKRIDYMLDAADIIHENIPSFVLIVIGDGPSSIQVERAAETRPWLKWVGAKKGFEKALYFKISSLVFNPGAVGLHILDAFVAGIPMVTTSDAKHGPEIAYIENGVNGVVVTGDASCYADCVINIFTDSSLCQKISDSAKCSASIYTLSKMVENFVFGIKKCLYSD